MVDYLPRLVDSLVAELLEDVSAVMIVGPRASGKTTVAARFAESVVRLDRPEEAAPFVASPDAALAALPTPVLLDEWQEVPTVLGAVKRAVDGDARRGRFLLAGSIRAQFEGTMWPATGRVVTVELFPLTVSERLRTRTKPLIDRLADGDNLVPAPDPPDLSGYIDLALEGGFPEAVLGVSPRSRRRWLDAYITHMVAHDASIALGGTGRDPKRIERYFQAYALNTAGVVNDNTLYEAAGINRKTAVSYEQMLINLMAVEKTPAWSTNRLKRLIRAPKRHVIDTGLWGAIVGVDVAAVIRNGDLLGRLLDSFVTAQLRAEAVVAAYRHKLHHLRTEQGRQEVDIVAEVGAHRVVGLEIKATNAPGQRDASHLAWMRDQLGDRFVAGVVLHTGPHTYQLSERITAAPICTLWSKGLSAFEVGFGA